MSTLHLCAYYQYVVSAEWYPSIVVGAKNLTVLFPILCPSAAQILAELTRACLFCVVPSAGVLITSEAMRQNAFLRSNDGVMAERLQSGRRRYHSASDRANQRRPNNMQVPLRCGLITWDRSMQGLHKERAEVSASGSSVFKQVAEKHATLA